MANPTELYGGVATVVTGTTQVSLTIDPHRIYTVFHTGLGTGLAADTNPVMLAIDGNVDADGSEGSDKFILLSQAYVEIGPGKSVVKFKTAAGAPTVCLSSGPNNQDPSRG